MIRLAIVGGGIRGRLYSKALKDQVEIVGFADPSEGTRKTLDDAGYRTYRSHTELLSREHPDAVIIATPDFAHREAAIDSAEAGAQLMIEKPLATTIDDAIAIGDAVAANGVQAMVGFENRWNPHFLSVQDALRDERLGNPVSQSFTLSNTLCVPKRMLSWSSKSSPLLFLHPHTLDLAFWLSGSVPVSVFARGHKGVLRNIGIDTWDVVHTSIRLEDDSLVDITSSWILPESAPAVADFTYQVVTDNGSAKVDMGSQGLSISHETYETGWPLDREVNGESMGMAAWMAQRFVRDIVDGARVSPGIEAGLRVTRTLEAIERSARTGSPVDMEELAA